MEVAEDMKSDFIIALTQLAAERSLPRDIVVSAIEAALVSAYKKDSIAAGQEISVKLDPGSGEVSVYLVKTVVEEVTDPLNQITLDEAKKVKPDAEIGAVIPTESLPHSAGRIAAQTAKQVVLQRLREADRELVYQEFADKEGDVFTGTVQKVEPRQIIVELGRAEAILPQTEQAPYERYRVGQKLKVLLQSIRRSNKGPELIVSRADKLLLKRMFEMEVPEIYNGSVEIINIAREAGSRSKVAVWAKQDGVDAVGSCVGLRGIRIQNIVNEMHGEKVDVVQWYKDPAAYIARSLSPSQVMRVDINEEEHSAVAIVPDRQLSLAIGREGQNARLAARLTGWKVDIKSNVEVGEEKGRAKAGVEVAEAAAPEPAAEQVEAKADEAAVQTAEAPAAEPVAVGAVEVVEAPAAKQAAEEPAVEVQVEAKDETQPEGPADAEKAPEDAVKAEPEPALVAGVPEGLFAPVAEPVPVEAASTSLHDLSEEIWSLRGGATTEPGVIRFAEDIQELRTRGPGRGRRGGGSRGGGAGRGRKTKSGQRR